MLSILAYIILGVYTLALVYITFYCLLQFNLLYHYQRHQQVAPLLSNVPSKEANLPFVTIQLPIFNERYVVERLIDNIMQLDYPKNRFEVQLLDDSTDETIKLSQQKVAEYTKKGFNITLVTRTDRTGFKAGALKYGTQFAKGEFIAIFDADFLPRTDFLKQTIPHFLANKKVGVVQTRWEHINQDYSLITKLQALQLNVHFTVEQQGRRAGNYMLQFNGTAGVWRKACIESAGGWEADTLTEDLDLSYRAQLKGWEIIYLEKVGAPAELPAEMNSLKAQQFRWMKGGAETARKMLPTVWKSDISFLKKIHATGHLLSSSIFLFVFIAGVFSVPLLFLLGEIGFNIKWFAIFLAGTLSVVAVYFVANVQAELKPSSPFKLFIKFIVLFPLFLSLSMGLSLHNSIAVLQGYLGKKSAFIRTPKFNIKNLTDSFKHNVYINRKLSWTTVLEGCLAIYFLVGAISGIYLENKSFLIFHSLLSLGYGTIFYYTIKHLSIK